MHKCLNWVTKDTEVLTVNIKIKPEKLLQMILQNKNQRVIWLKKYNSIKHL